MFKQEHGYQTLVMVGDGATDLEVSWHPFRMCEVDLSLTEFESNMANWMCLKF